MTSTTLPAEEKVVQTDTPVVNLDTTHRCDRCGAQAYIETTLTNGFVLLFCNHHWLEYKPTMEKQKIVNSVKDESFRLKPENRAKGSEHS